MTGLLIAFYFKLCIYGIYGPWKVSEYGGTANYDNI